MATPFFARQLRPSLSSSDASGFICRSCRRNAATYRRTRKALRVKTDPSFAPAQTETQDHIIFNPPASAPNVYHTPSKFLPKSDPRRALYTSSQEQEPARVAAENPAAPMGVLASIAAQRKSSVPPAKELQPLKPIKEKQYHLTEEEIVEIQRLRAENPRQWTRQRLAEKFECSQFFISLCCSSPEAGKEHGERLAEIQSKWGRKKKEAREARKERKKLWGMDV